MSDVRVVIQRDSEREERVVTTGTTAAELFAGERTIVAARVAGELKDLAYEVKDGETVESVEISSEDGLNILRHSTAHVMAQAVQELFPEAKLGIGPPVKDGFYYDFDVEKPFTPEDLKAVEKKMQEIQKRGQRFSRRVVTDEAAREELASEPYKLELIGIKGSAFERRRRGRRGRRRRADHLRQPRRQDRRPVLEGPLPRSPPADHPEHPGVQADAQRGRVLARQREEPDAPAHLRHRVADQGRAEGAPRLPRRGREARPPQARQRAGPVLHPGADRLRPRRLPPQGRHHPPGHGGLLAAPPRGRGLRVRLHPARDEGEALRDLGPPGLVRRRHVPAHAARRGRGLLPQAHELPDAQPDLRRARPLLP